MKNSRIVEIANDLSMNDFLSLLDIFSDRITIHDTTEGANGLEPFKLVDDLSAFCLNGPYIQINIVNEKK